MRRAAGKATLSHTNNSIYTIAKADYGKYHDIRSGSSGTLWRIVQFGHRVRHGYGIDHRGQRVDSGAGESLNNERGLPKYLS